MRFPRHLLTIDFETFWSNEWTLKKLPVEEYVRGAQFLDFGAAIKYGDQPSRWVDADRLPAFFAGVPWDDTAVLCQNTLFDGAILSWRYGVRPALWLDTLAMSRMALPRDRHSLAELAAHFGLPPKGGATSETKGLRVLPPDVRARLASYACHDADLTREILLRLMASIPVEELKVIDLTIRMYTEPRLTLNRQRARDLLAKVIRNKRSARQRLGVSSAELLSTDKFAALLVDRFGLDVEMKPGKPKEDGTPRWLPAVAKNDQFMKSLKEHENPDIQALAAARLGEKSTLEETRLYRLLGMDSRGPLPVFLNFAGAHTFRWSGGDKMNWQNFPRGSELRRCIEAWDGVWQDRWGPEPTWRTAA